MKPRIFGLLLFFLFCSAFSIAQTADSTIVKIETSDGNEFIGKIITEDTLSIVLNTDLYGELTIQKANIKSKKIVQSQQIKGGKLWFDNPQSTRYFWAPNGYGVKKGEGYYQNIYVLWNQFTYGVSDNFSLGAGIIPLFLFAGAPTPIFATLKISLPIQKDKFNLAAGAIAGTVIGEDVGSFGILYGISTFGTPDNNVSVGLGYGFAEGELASSPLINISGLLRISSRGYILTENYYIQIDGVGGGLISLGGRWIIKKASLDFALAVPIIPDMGTFIAIPLIGFTIPFGNNEYKNSNF
ncbi:hypothetical protein N9164_11975 [Draconibacterium sp.]|nr:hypothetical protein [Draconibacterium sp.]